MKASVRPSPAMIVALTALVAALAGSAVALPGKNKVDKNDIKKNAIKGKQVVDDSLTGADVNEASLGQVPDAAKASAADSVAGTSVVRRTVVNENTPDVTLATVGPFTITLNCNDEGGTTAYLEVRSTEADSLVRSGFGGSDDLDPGEVAIITDQNDAAGGGPSLAPAGNTSFRGLAPGGTALDGSLNLLVDGVPGTCTVWGQVLNLG